MWKDYSSTLLSSSSEEREWKVTNYPSWENRRRITDSDAIIKTFEDNIEIRRIILIKTRVGTVRVLQDNSTVLALKLFKGEDVWEW